MVCADTCRGADTANAPGETLVECSTPVTDKINDELAEELCQSYQRMRRFCRLDLLVSQAGIFSVLLELDAWPKLLDLSLLANRNRL